MKTKNTLKYLSICVFFPHYGFGVARFGIYGLLRCENDISEAKNYIKNAQGQQDGGSRALLTEQCRLRDVCVRAGKERKGHGRKEKDRE